MKRLYFIRHGKTQYNEERRYLGTSDLSLSTNGRNELVSKWSSGNFGIEFNCIYSSPMKRCIETSEIIFPDEKPVIINDIKEMDFGIFEGKSYDELALDPVYKEFIKTRGLSLVPEAEKGVDFASRVQKGFFEILADMNKHSFDNAVIISHGGVVMALFAALCKESSDIYYYAINNGECFVTDYHNKELKIIKKL